MWGRTLCPSQLISSNLETTYAKGVANHHRKTTNRSPAVLPCSSWPRVMMQDRILQRGAQGHTRHDGQRPLLTVVKAGSEGKWGNYRLLTASAIRIVHLAHYQLPRHNGLQCEHKRGNRLTILGGTLCPTWVVLVGVNCEDMVLGRPAFAKSLFGPITAQHMLVLIRNPNAQQRLHLTNARQPGYLALAQSLLGVVKGNGVLKI